MPTTALNGGADISICSAHKTLGSIQATALINVGKNSIINPQKVKDAFYLMNTSSPNAMLLADVESSVVTMVNEGEYRLAKVIQYNTYFRQRL